MSNTTCFREHNRHNVNCEKETCQNWIDCSECCNCSIVGAIHGPYTHEQISKIVGLTRLKVYRIEREALKKTI